MNTLAELLSSRVKAEIFRLLFGVVPRELHGREIERQSGLADGTVRQELKRLLGLGVVESRLDGNRTYYRANTRHPLYPDIRNLVLKTDGLVEALRTALEPADIPLAFVFGSVAAGTEQAESDVDLIVIGTVSLRQLGKLLSGVTAQVGREINPHIFTLEEFTRRKKARDHFISTVLAAPKLFVKGNEDELVTMGQ
ncbi:MAG: nucleotidyltransferase domain-containing protein [Acidobacteria bacterium]|nr:nucleotidyltransferase domain-containing protein [Acidobacteriota bacterium]